jgi:hypothetical protein
VAAVINRMSMVWSGKANGVPGALTSNRPLSGM